MSNKRRAPLRPKRVGRPPGADADRTRTLILDAALDAFADRGYDGASIRDITNSIGVGHNLVRHHFGSKDDLWRAVVRRGFGEATEATIALFEALGERPTEETLRDGMEILLRSFAANPALARVFGDEALRGGERFEFLYDEFLEPAGRAMFGFFQGRREDFGGIQPQILGMVAVAVAAAPFTYGALAERVGIPPPSADGPLSDQAAQMIEAVAALVRHA